MRYSEMFLPRKRSFRCGTDQPPAHDPGRPDEKLTSAFIPISLIPGDPQI